MDFDCIEMKKTKPTKNKNKNKNMKKNKKIHKSKDTYRITRKFSKIQINNTIPKSLYCEKSQQL